MSLVKYLTQREFEKFRSNASLGTAIAVVNPDGSDISISGSSSNATVYQGNLPWEISTSSLPTISIGNTVTVDSELPAAAALTDDTSNPTTPLLGAALLVYDGNNSNWNRAREIQHGADMASGFLGAGILGEFDDTSPTSVTENQFGHLRMSTERYLYTEIRDAAGNERGANVDSSGNLNVVFPSGATVNVSNGLSLDSGATVQPLAAWPDPGTFIGLSTIVVGDSMVTVTLGTQLDSTNDSVDIKSGATVTPLQAWPDPSDFVGLVSTASIQGEVDIVEKTTGVGKTLNISSIALSASNLSGATVFVASASNTFYITNLILSTSSNVGVAFISNGTYLTGNASLRMQLAPQSGIIENANVDAPLYFGLTAQTNFLIATDSDAPVSGRVTWYEE